MLQRFGLILVSVIFLFVVSGCAASYRPVGPFGGYFETQLDANTYRVEYNGGAFATQSQATTALIYRSAELTHLKGYDSFVVLFHYTVVIGATVAAAVISMFDAESRPPPEVPLNLARDILEDKAYHGRISAHAPVANERGAFPVGMEDYLQYTSYASLQLDAQSFLVDMQMEGYGTPKVVDHTLLYRCAELTIGMGADYYVLSAGDKQIAMSSLHYGLFRSIDTPVYSRSLICRAFRGKKPPGYAGAIAAREVLANAQVQLPAQRGYFRRDEYDDSCTLKDTKLEGNATAVRFQCRLSKRALIGHLLYRSAELTVQQGYDYFVLEPRSLRFEGPYLPDGSYVGFAGVFRVFTGRPPLTDLLAYDAREVLKVIGPIYKSSLGSVLH